MWAQLEIIGWKHNIWQNQQTSLGWYGTSSSSLELGFVWIVWKDEQDEKFMRTIWLTIEGELFLLLNNHSDRYSDEHSDEYSHEHIQTWKKLNIPLQTYRHLALNDYGFL